MLYVVPTTLGYYQRSYKQVPQLLMLNPSDEYHMTAHPNSAWHGASLWMKFTESTTMTTALVDRELCLLRKEEHVVLSWEIPLCAVMIGKSIDASISQVQLLKAVMDPIDSSVYSHLQLQAKSCDLSPAVTVIHQATIQSNYFYDIYVVNVSIEVPIQLGILSVSQISIKANVPRLAHDRCVVHVQYKRYRPIVKVSRFDRLHNLKRNCHPFEDTCYSFHHLVGNIYSWNAAVKTCTKFGQKLLYVREESDLRKVQLTALDAALAKEDSEQEYSWKLPSTSTDNLLSNNSFDLNNVESTIPFMSLIFLRMDTIVSVSE